MKSAEKALTMIWLNEIVDNPDTCYLSYLSNEQQSLAKNALALIGDIDCVIYIVTHKDYPNTQDDLYKTLCVGDYRADGFLSEHDGISIPDYNAKINECTGLYWMWKNATSDYVGLCHYRRFFYRESYPDDPYRIDKQRIKGILVDDDYDIILSPKIRLDWSVYQNMCQMVGEDFCDTGYKLFLRAIADKQPEYVNAFRKVFGENRMYVCNMFITRREILNRYCEWLFSFLLDTADKFDMFSGNSLQKRTIGYFAEVMWTVWLEKQDLKVYEMPIMLW